MDEQSHASQNEFSYAYEQRDPLMTKSSLVMQLIIPDNKNRKGHLMGKC